MKFSSLADHMERIERTSERLEITEMMKQLFLEAGDDEVGSICYLLLGTLGADYEGRGIGMADTLVLRSISRAAGTSEITAERKLREKGDIGQMAFELPSNRKIRKLVSKEITVSDCYGSVVAFSKLSGKRSIMQRIDRLSSLLADMSPKEGKYLARYVTGQLRLGISEITLLDALSQAFAGGKEARQEVEEAFNIRPDIGRIAVILKKQGLTELRKNQDAT